MRGPPGGHVAVCRDGLLLASQRGGERELLPLYAGAMHYWRHPPEAWAPGLDAIRSLGLRLVDTYIPWDVHEQPDGTFDFGERDRRLDIARFFQLAKDRGLYVIARPGPHINAELTRFGIPERVVWNPDVAARTPKGNPVVLPMVPLAFPVPSYASSVFFDEATRWLRAAREALAPHFYPAGPVVLLQVDNEGALYFRDGPFDQDYHPDAIAAFRAFLTEKYGTDGRLRGAWQDDETSLATATAPVTFASHHDGALARVMDWMEFHEHLLAQAMRRFVAALSEPGPLPVPTMHNLPMGEGATPLNAARLGGTLDFVGLDYYQRANPVDHLIVMRRTTELAARADGTDTPAFGAEVGVGFPPFFAPLDEQDSLYTLLAALAYGLRGYNLYMAVERDRWVGAPIDREGRRRPFADKLERLTKVLLATQFHTLRRRVPVRLVVPRALRRLARASHAFGAVTPALLHVLGTSLRESCFEEGYVDGEAPPIVAERTLRAFERALAQRGVPFAYVGGESLAGSLDGARWIVCPTPGGLKAEVLASLRDAAAGGAVVTIGPRAPTRDGNLLPLATPHDVTGLEIEPLEDLARADALVARRIEDLALPTYPLDADGTYFAVHETAGGRPRVAFLLNPTAAAVVARVAFEPAKALVDALDGTPVRRVGGDFEIAVPARTVRLFVVE